MNKASVKFSEIKEQLMKDDEFPADMSGSCPVMR